MFFGSRREGAGVRIANHLFYGDNLEVLREHVPDDSIDLIYLDPPFNSNANYNILFKSPAGTSSAAQIEAFEDTWHWNEVAEHAFDQVAQSGNTKAFELLNAMRAFLGENDMMAYLSMMAVRLIELHRVLKPTGSLYLHCDPTASHYLKMLLDGVFGAERFRNEIIWKRTGVHGDSKTWSRVSDTIFFYTKGTTFTWNDPIEPHTDAYVASHYSHSDEAGRRFQLTSMLSPSPRPNMMYEWKGFPSPPMGWRYSRERMAELDAAGSIWYPRTAAGDLGVTKRPRYKRYQDEQIGTRVGTVWSDIAPINARAQERLGYPTQKPLALLERILAASSNPGDVVLDPFSGCGTAIHAAQKLGRRWIGIDVTHLAISLIEKRVRDAFPGIALTVEGTPKDMAGAEDLARRDKYQFQWWAVSMVDAMPFGGRKKGADGEIDGIIYFKPDGRRTAKALVSVKGGDNVSVPMIRDLHSAMERDKAPIGVFITKRAPTGAMAREAAAVGRYHCEATGRSYARLQILTVASLFDGKRPNIPLIDTRAAFKQAGREDRAEQHRLL